MTTIALVVIDAEKLLYTRYLNRCRDVKVRLESPLTAAEVGGFRTNPGACVEHYVPPEPVSA